MDRFTALVEAVASSVASLPATIYTYFFPDSDPQCSCGQTMPRDEHGHRVKRAINGEETGENQYPWQAGSCILLEFFLKLILAINRKQETNFLKMYKNTHGLGVAR